MYEIEKIRKISLSFVLILFLIGLIIPYGAKFSADSVPNNSNWIQTDPPKLKSAGYWTNFTFIHINGNWSTAASKEWCSGDGSWETPYVLENLVINATYSPIESGIKIENSITDYFIIRNCTIFNDAGTNYAVYFTNTCNGTITQNNCSNNLGYGIRFSSNCKNNTILNNEINHNIARGILLSSNCDDNKILENNISDNSLYGIRIETNSDNNLVSGNTFTNTPQGYDQQQQLYVTSTCTGNNITYNTVNGGNFGIQVLGASTNTLVDHNIVNLSNNDAVIISSSDNAIISNNQILGAGSTGLNLLDSSECTVSDNIIRDGDYRGLNVQGDSQENEFRDNYIAFNDDYGVTLVGGANEPFNNVFIDNLIWKNADGLLTRQFVVGAGSALLSENSIGHTADMDGDGLSDYDEYETYGTNRKLSDTDQDGFSDSFELDQGTDPLDPDDYPLIESDINGDSDKNASSLPEIYILLIALSFTLALLSLFIALLLFKQKAAIRAELKELKKSITPAKEKNRSTPKNRKK